jgi:hypothetical protein
MALPESASPGVDPRGFRWFTTVAIVAALVWAGVHLLVGSPWTSIFLLVTTLIFWAAHALHPRIGYRRAQRISLGNAFALILAHPIILFLSNPGYLAYLDRQINDARMAKARPGAFVLHPGPMNEGVEISASVAHGAASLVEEQVGDGQVVVCERVWEMRTSKVPQHVVERIHVDLSSAISYCAI